MPRNRAAIWLVVSMMLWVSVAVAEAAAAAEQEELRGLVIEEIPKGSVLGKAGLQVGDVILRWERPPNPPANPEAAKGEVTSYFDWLELEVEQVPRGAVVLRGRRNGIPLELRGEPGVWDAKVRPLLSTALDGIFEQGKAQLAAGELKRAVETWRKLANNVADSDYRDLRAWTMLRIGEAWAENGEWEKAIEEYRAALKAVGPRAAQAPLFEAIGKIHERKNDYKAAEASYNAALRASEMDRRESLTAAKILTSLGDSAWAQGELNRAHEYFSKALDIDERLAPRSLPVATSLSNLGVIAWTRGELDRAHDYFLSALQIEEQLAPQGLGVSNSLNNLGELAWSRGDLASARDFHLRALAIRQDLVPEGFEVAVSLNNLGIVAQESGDLDQALAYHQRALQLFEAFAPQSVFVATSLNNLGTLTWERGEFARAHDYHLRALRIIETLAPQSIDLAINLDNLGNVAWAQGKLDRAREYQLRALRIRQQLAPNSLEVALSLHNLGSVARDRGDLYQAQHYLLQALEIREHLAPQSLLVAFSVHNLGEVALARSEIDRAREHFFRALKIFQQIAPHSLDVVKTLNSLGDVARIRKELRLSYDYYSQAVNELEHLISRLGGSYNVQASFRFQQGEFYSDLIDLLLTQNRFAEAFQMLERSRAQTFLAMLSERDLVFTADIPEELDHERRRVAVLYDGTLKKLTGLNTHGDTKEIEAVRTELRRLEDEAGDIEATIRQTSPRLAVLRYPQSLDTAETREMLDHGTLLLSYSIGKKETTLFATSRSGDLELKILPLGEEVLRSRVKQLLGLLAEARMGSSIGKQRRTQLQAISRELYTELLGPVADRITASERLLILPDGPLHALPFAALMRDTENGPQYLGAWKPLHVALSATVFAELKQGRRPSGEQNTVPAPLQLAAFGDPVYPQSLAALKVSSTGLPADGDVVRGDPTVRGAAERGLFDFQPLPHSRREVLGIAKLFPEGSARTFLGPEALEERIKSLDPNTRILHLAAHGSVDEHLPSGSFIALTIPEQTASEETGPQRDNGLLQVWEIFERVRLNADLVVLSACDTGLGEELGGEGLIGLTRAFQYAGARTVMASLWSVQDQATSELMIRFYKHLRAGLTKDRALQAAQQELIRGPIEVTNDKGERMVRDFSAPYYWAGFQLYGDWQ